MCIRSFVYADSRVVRRAIIRSHKRSLDILSWTCARRDWWTAESDSDDEFFPENPNYRILPPNLSDLRNIEPSARYKRQCFHPEEDFRGMLDVIHTYLCPALPLETLDYHEQQQELTWELFRFQDRLWVWNNQSSEWFFLDDAPTCWRRYYWFLGFPRDFVMKIYWWHHASGRRWFQEPVGGRTVSKEAVEAILVGFDDQGVPYQETVIHELEPDTAAASAAAAAADIAAASDS